MKLTYRNITYKEKKELKTVRVVYASGEIPAYSSTFYWKLYSKKPMSFEESKEFLIARVKENQLDPKNLEKVKEVYGFSWLEKIYEREKIYVQEGTFDDYEEFINSHCDYPDAKIYGIGHGAIIIETKKSVILRVVNNKDRVVRGELKKGLKKLFPDQTIIIRTSVTTVTEEVL